MRSNTVCAFIFARMSCWPDHLTRQFHSMQESLEQVHDLGLTRFLWMHEILGRLPFTFNAVGQEIINFDDQPTSNAFVDHMVELDGYFHDHYLTLASGHYPVWIWKTDTIRGNFVQAAEDARSAVLDRVGKDLAAIGDELAQFLDTTGLEQRLPAFLALSHYGVYTPRFTNQFVGRLSFAHTDFTIDNLLRWVQIIRDRGSDNIYQQPMT